MEPHLLNIVKPLPAVRSPFSVIEIEVVGSSDPVGVMSEAEGTDDDGGAEAAIVLQLNDDGVEKRCVH